MSNQQITNEPPDYLAYLLRLWREEGSSAWRAILVDTNTGTQHGFANLSEMESFLRQQTNVNIVVSTEHDLD